MTRPLCSACNQSLVAVNYIRQGHYHYRRLCDGCIRKGKKFAPVPPAWLRAGYRKSAICDKCGWRAKYPDRQISVFHIDGNLKNNNPLNLRSVCLNCRVEVAASKLPWKESPIIPDF